MGRQHHRKHNNSKMVFGLFCKKKETPSLPENLRAAFAPLKVLNPKGESVQLGDVLAKDKPSIFWVMRRFSCPFCRAYAAKLRDSVYKKADEKGVQMVALGLEMAGLEAFQEGKFWPGELFIENKDLEVHKFLNLKRASILKLFDVKMFKEGSKPKRNSEATPRRATAWFW